MDQRAIVDLLAKSALFGPLPEPDLTAIAARMRRVDFEPDQMIFSRGELSFAHAGPGNIFGEIATLDGGERTANATAITKVQTMALPQKAVLELIENNPKVAQAAIRFLCTRLRETDQRLEAIALHRIEVRLARLLLSALRLQEPASAGQNVALDLGMSQGELALLIGASRPKVNIALTLLQDMGAITRNGSKLSCNTEVLQSIAEME